jgi:hypothetical protein
MEDLEMRLTSALLIAVMLAAPALAHEGGGPRGAVREACKADTQALCQGIQPGEGRMRACLRANREKLSQPCRDAIASAIEARAARLEQRAAKWRSGAPPQPAAAP